MAAHPYDQKCFHRNPALVSQLVIDEYILVSLEPGQLACGQYYVMNEIGGRVWDLIDGQRRVEDIVGAVADEYQIEREDCESDLRAFIEHLERIGAVKPI